MVSVKVVFGSSEDMRELRDDSIALVVTSPPYYNAPFDFPNLFKSYDDFLGKVNAKIIGLFVGPVKVKTTRVSLDEIFREHLESLGWSHEVTLIDTIVSRRLAQVRINPATGLEDERTPTEHLLIMVHE